MHTRGHWTSGVDGSASKTRIHAGYPPPSPPICKSFTDAMATHGCFATAAAVVAGVKTVSCYSLRGHISLSLCEWGNRRQWIKKTGKFFNGFLFPIDFLCREDGLQLRPFEQGDDSKSFMRYHNHLWGYAYQQLTHLENMTMMIKWTTLS